MRLGCFRFGEAPFSDGLPASLKISSWIEEELKRRRRCDGKERLESAEHFRDDDPPCCSYLELIKGELPFLHGAAGKGMVARSYCIKRNTSVSA